MLFDIRYALRLLLKSPRFSAMTVLIMSCGLALTLYMVSVINTFMFSPLPYVNGKSMVLLNPVVNGASLGDSGLNYLDYQSIKARNTMLDDMGYITGERADVSDGNQAVSYMAIRCTGRMFSYTGVSPIKGRTFNQADTEPGAKPVAIISYTMWQNYFAGNESILNLSVMINGVRTRIVGVMPKGFAFPFYQNLWLPSQLNPSQFLTRKHAPEVMVYARLQPGVSMDKANRDLSRVMKTLAVRYPETNKGLSAQALTFQENFMGEESIPIFIVMLIAVGFVLILVCCNVGNLLLVRTTERAKEIAIRVALGSPTVRLVMQMMWESLFICLMSGVIAVLLAGWGLDVTNHFLPGIVANKLPFWWHMHLHRSMVILALVLVILTALMTSALPAWKITHGHFNDVLRDGTRGAQSRSAGRISRILVTFEVGLSCSILCISVLLGVLVYQATHVNYGVRTQGYLTGQIYLNTTRYPDEQSRVLFYQKLQTVLDEIPGIDSASITTSTAGQFTLPVQVVLSRSTKNSQEKWSYPLVNDVQVMPGSLSGMGIKTLYGREFNMSDDRHSQPVVVVSESFAKQYWPGVKNVIGKQLRLRYAKSQHGYRVIGVVKHVIYGRPFGAFLNRAAIYRSLLQQAPASVNVVIHAKNPALLRSLGPALMTAVRQVDRNLSVSHIQTLDERLAHNTAGLHFIAALFMIFGLVAMILAATGIYAVMCNVIHQRVQEMGVRMAMGATQGALLRMLMLQGAKQLLAGLVIGLPLALSVAPKLTHILGDGKTGFILLFIEVALIISLVVAAAIWFPSRRAAGMSPADAIRYE